MPGHELLSQTPASHYRILNLGISLRSDSTELLGRFDQDYGWFRVREGTGEGDSLVFTARFHGEAPGLSCTRTRKEDNSEVSALEPHQIVKADMGVPHSSFVTYHSFKGHPNPVSYALHEIFRMLFAEITDFIVLHAAVLEKDGRALILAGPPGIGKSTLTLALLERGFRFMSDDFCPVERTTGLVHPFPRSAYFREKNPSGRIVQNRRDKQILAPQDLAGPICEIPSALGWLISLDSGQKRELVQLAAGLRNAGEDLFIKDMKEIDNVILKRLSSDFPEWLINYPSGKGLSPLVRQVIDNHRNNIWNIYRSDRVCPNFDQSPCLRPLSSHEAALRMIRDLKHEPDAVVSGRANAEGPGAFFACLTTLLSHCDCYLMRVGRLEETIERILETVEAKGSENKATRLRGAPKWLL